VLVDNPEHNLKGDYSLTPQGTLSLDPTHALTYSGISVLRPELFAHCTPGSAFRLAPLFNEAHAKGQLFGEHFKGAWTDVGTLARLQNLEQMLALQTRKIS
jgi:MurNAc alpha-1-phosphate uridylyltransferase